MKTVPMKCFPAFFAVVLLAACAPPGRGLFAPAPQKPSVATVDLTEGTFGRVPLVTIPAGTAPAGYSSALGGAIEAAEARKADVVFDIVSAVPQTGTVLDQISAAEALSPQAKTVAGVVAGAGVPAERVTLGAMVVAGLAAPEIRVYVR